MPWGSATAQIFPGLGLLLRYGILKREDTSRRGKRAYYTMIDSEEVARALRELGIAF
jgi:hypothetical protein